MIGRPRKYGEHIHTNDKIHLCWRNMMSRCYSMKNKYYKYYGGRGIYVSAEWHDFLIFYKDMNHLFFHGAQIDRINNDLGYSKENCKWSTALEQANNKRNNIKLNGETVKEATSKLIGANKAIIRVRLSRGWRKEDAFTKPVRVLIKFKGESPSEAEKRLGLGDRVIYGRISRGWSIEKAFTTGK